MAKKPTTDVSTYSKPAYLPGFLVELMLSFLVVRGLVKGSTGVNGEAGKMFRHEQRRAGQAFELGAATLRFSGCGFCIYGSPNSISSISSAIIWITH